MHRHLVGLVLVLAISCRKTGDPLVEETDSDGDGVSVEDGDCDDSDGDVLPSAVEICDGVDQNCDGEADEGLATATYYPDADEDGFGDDTAALTACAQPDGTLAVAGDCDDQDNDVNPDADEVCNDTDDDCDDTVDGPDAIDVTAWYSDGDGDGSGAGAAVYACEAPVDHVSVADDCDDVDAAIHPGATETDCTDPIDYNCDGATGFVDTDGDGFAACKDCDDEDEDVNPDAVEVCNGVDDDCDGGKDVDATDQGSWFVDGDADGHGDEDATPLIACGPVTGYADTADDCDDTDEDVSPDGEELCNGVDDDCDGSTDDPSATDAPLWYTDGDGDGHGDSADIGISACAQPAGRVASHDDCDDVKGSVYPGASEVCDGANTDEDCDALADDADPTATGKATFYADADSDTFGDATTSTTSCEGAPTGFVPDATDCNDGSALISPADVEVCDASNTDEDCDGSADDGDTGATGKTTYYRDVDGDTYGNALTTVTSCESAPSGYVPNGTDCADGDNTAHPTHVEFWYNGVDNACDGGNDYDQDSDGATVFPSKGDDCDDTNASLVACGLSASSALFDCKAINDAKSGMPNGLYHITAGGAPFQAYCDQTTDGGGWTLVARAHDGSTAAHRSQAAVGTLTAPNQTTTAKYADARINALRGTTPLNSILRMRVDDGSVDYFRETRAFDALGYTNSINRVFDTYATAVSQTSPCNGQYNSTYHTGLVGWTCYDYMLYADNPGMRDVAYQAGAIWVKRL